MKKFSIPLITFLFASFFLTGNALASRGGMKWEGSGGWGSGAKYHAMYDAKTVASVSGVVEKVEVKGSRITFEGKPAIIAVSAKKGDDTLVLRDESGIPAWAGWRKR